MKVISFHFSFFIIGSISTRGDKPSGEACVQCDKAKERVGHILGDGVPLLLLCKDRKGERRLDRGSRALGGLKQIKEKNKATTENNTLMRCLHN